MAKAATPKAITDMVVRTGELTFGLSQMDQYLGGMVPMSIVNTSPSITGAKVMRPLSSSKME